jgi:phosphoglycolate phosphatase
MTKVKFGEKTFDTKLVIFDKDGTLMDFKKVWIPVLQKRTELILASLDPGLPKKKIKKEIYRILGVTVKSINSEVPVSITESIDSKVSIDPHGPFIYTSRREDLIITASVLYRFGIPWQKAKTIAQDSAEKVEAMIDRTALAAIPGTVKKTLMDLHDKGISLALATADHSKNTHNILTTSGIDGLFDYVICSDMVKADKPDPEMLEKIISELKADRKKVVFVGDAITDMEMGKRAGIGLVVGVLEYGIAKKEDLMQHADVVIDSIRDIRVIE